MEIPKGFLFALIIIFIAVFVMVGFSQEDKKEGVPREKTTIDQKPSEKDLKPQEDKKPEAKKSALPKEAKQKDDIDTAELVRESQRNLDRALSTLNTVATLIGVLIAVLALVVTIAGATGFFQLRKGLTIRKDIEEDAKYVKEIRDKAERDLDSMRNELEKVRKPSLFEEPSIESKDAFDYFGRRLDNFEALGLPLNSEDYNNRGLDYLNKEKYLLSLRDFEKAIELESDNADAWYYKGYALHELEKYKEALKAYDIAIELNPKNNGAFNQRGCVFFELDQYEKALAEYEKALELMPEMFSSLVGKTLSLYHLKRYDEALKALDKAIEKNPEYEDTWYYRARIYSIKRNKEKTLSDLSRAIELDAKNKKEAKEDKDFKWLWEDAEFKNITS